MAERIIVVGAGVAGLAAAVGLTSLAEVEVVERLPEVGGTWGFEDTTVAQLRRHCDALGVRLTLGVTALRWVDRRLLLVGPGERSWRRADHLVFAGGSRPATAAELPLFGARVAGVFAGTVAHHLLEARVPLGERPVICGEGYWADLVRAELPQPGWSVAVGAEGNGESWPDHRPVAVRGRDRVEELVIAGPDGELTIACDCVVLAGDQRPLRNVDGAILDGPGLTFAQPCADRLTAAEVVDDTMRTIASLTRRTR